MNWITFIGEGRSGHTILSAILDSHPNVRLSEEQKYISKWYREGWGRERILKELHASGYGKERATKKLPGMLTYKDPLLAVGDKCGWDAINEIRKRNAPITILEDFGNMMKMDIKVIHSSRNPFDNICAWLDSPKYQRIYKEPNTLYRKMIKRYRKFYETAEQVIPISDVYHVRNEELCLEPEKVISGLCEWLNIDKESVWFENAVNSVLKSPNQRSKKREWPPEYEKRINQIIETFPSLRYYSDKN